MKKKEAKKLKELSENIKETAEELKEEVNEEIKEEKSSLNIPSLISPGINAVKGIIDLFKGLLNSVKEINIVPIFFLAVTAFCCVYNLSHPDKKN